MRMRMRIVHFLVVAANLSAFYLVLAVATILLTSTVHEHLVARPALAFVQ